MDKRSNFVLLLNNRETYNSCSFAAFWRAITGHDEVFQLSKWSTIGIIAGLEHDNSSSQPPWILHLARI